MTSPRSDEHARERQKNDRPFGASFIFNHNSNKAKKRLQNISRRRFSIKCNANNSLEFCRVFSLWGNSTTIFSHLFWVRYEYIKILYCFFFFWKFSKFINIYLPNWRIGETITCHRGHVLLVGLEGCGKKSITRLASFTAGSFALSLSLLTRHILNGHLVEYLAGIPFYVGAILCCILHVVYCQR